MAEVKLRLSDEQKEELSQRARESGGSVNAYLLSVLFGVPAASAASNVEERLTAVEREVGLLRSVVDLMGAQKPAVPKPKPEVIEKLKGELGLQTAGEVASSDGGYRCRVPECKFGPVASPAAKCPDHPGKLVPV